MSNARAILIRRWFVLALFAGCSGESSAIDAGPPDAVTCRAAPNDSGVLGRIPQEGGTCAPCIPIGDSVCEVTYPDPAPGCAAYCDGECLSACPGENCRYTPDAGGCSPGDGRCQIPGFAGTYVCDPACGAAGGCRHCIFDSECQAEVAPDAKCVRHCGWCCLDDRPPYCSDCI